ncbi:MAG TPA: 5-formyltetrahydrofolate cyclo-ligase [Clostridia bacterium]|nr:5-formyltetrahydrofolate cyclo-ligase [Clostridia bacterium]
MNCMVREAKTRVRQRVLSVLKTLGDEESARASTAARRLLQQQPQWQEAKSVLLFAPMAGELDIWPLVGEALAEGRVVALPRFDRVTRCYSACRIQSCEQDIKPGHFGIREPATHCDRISLNRLDLILVPGLAFDVHGHRLGKGKGYYDQMLAGVRGVTCGVGFDQQIVEHIPVEPHDVDLKCILTPTRWVNCLRGSWNELAG